VLQLLPSSCSLSCNSKQSSLGIDVVVARKEVLKMKKLFRRDSSDKIMCKRRS
jgi:hypothetical protein